MFSDKILPKIVKNNERMFRINKIAVLGSGLMGSAIACHLAGCGFDVLLLDLTHQSQDRNQITKKALDKCLASKPSPLYDKNFLSRIQIGNFDDDLSKLQLCDWIVEVIIENIEIKKQLYAKIENHRKPGTIVSTNTSGIPIHMLLEGRSEDFKQHFIGTHFFNPPRYLRLLEIIPTKSTKKDVTEFLLAFGKTYLGKKTVLCNDTPAFIANRIGVVSMAKIFNLAHELKLSISDVDKLTGTAIGRPKSGTFRLTDLVGLDTAIFVITDLKKNCLNDEIIQELQLPTFINFLIDHKWFGNKSGQGFFLKTDEKDSTGKTKFLSLDLQNHEYNLDTKSNLESIKIAKQIEDLPKRLKALIKLQDTGAILIRKLLGFLFAYASQRIPESSNSIESIDEAMRNGFGWELGPFETWDVIGFTEGIQLIEAVSQKPAAWVIKMIETGKNQFYKFEEQISYVLDPLSGTYNRQTGQEHEIKLNHYNSDKCVYKNDELRLIDIGDGVLCAEFKSKYNAIGEGILKGLQESIHIAESQKWNGLVIGNNATNFTVGANLMLIGMLAFQQEYDQLDMAVRLFQQTSMRCRYSSIPVIAATQGYVIGGGVELLMHCDAAICAAESYIGLVEMGVGLLPGGGGTKEFTIRLSDELKETDVQIPQLIQRFKTLATAAVATSGFEAFDLGYLNKTRDAICIYNGFQIQLAKQKVLSLATNYIQANQRRDIQVLGRSGLAALYAATNSMKLGGYASDHDVKIAHKIANVLCGGDLSYPQKVSENYLLDLEREAFLSLCTEPKTMERIQYMLENNKPLRN